MLLLVLLGFLAFILLVIACTLWRHNDISGQCSLANSGTTFLDEAADKECWDSVKNRPKYNTFKQCLKVICNLSSEPYFGQCDAIPLAIASASLALAYVLACFVLSYEGDPTMYLAITNLLAAAVFG